LTPLWLVGLACFGAKRRSAAKRAHSKIFGRGTRAVRPFPLGLASPVTPKPHPPTCGLRDYGPFAKSHLAKPWFHHAPVEPVARLHRRAGDVAPHLLVDISCRLLPAQLPEVGLQQIKRSYAGLLLAGR
jgi:hypothetical protein